MATYGTLENEDGTKMNHATITVVEEGKNVHGQPTVRGAYENLRSAQSINEKAKYTSIIYGVLCTSLLFSIVLAILNLIPLYMLILGTVHLNDCPAQRYIPIYLIVDGIFFFARYLAFCSYRYAKRDPNDYHVAAVRQAPALNLINLFLFIWLICGTVWVFGANPDLEHEISGNYCDRLTYNSAHAYIVVQWLVLPAILFIACCVMCAAAVVWREG